MIKSLGKQAMCDSNYCPQVSVVMSVYNGSYYLCEAIDSILSQTYDNFEFIIIDDCSTDTTADILDGFYDPRIVRLSNKSNVGLTRSLNRGIAIARGYYIARQDSDDISLPHRLELQIAELEQRPTLAAVFSAYKVIDKNGHEVSSVYPPVDAEQIRETLLFTNPLRHSNATIRLASLQSVNGYDESYRVAQDYDLWLRLSEQFDIDVLPKVLSKVRIHDTSLATGLSRREQRQNANRARLASFNRRDTDNMTKRTIGLFHFVVALHEFSEGNNIKGEKHLELALIAEPALDGEINTLLGFAVNLAVELGPSGRKFLNTAKDIQVASDFLQIVANNIPEGSLPSFKKEVFSEFHAACAFLFHQQKKPLYTARHVVQSWWCGPRHRKNWGLIKLILRSL